LAQQRYRSSRIRVSQTGHRQIWTACPALMVSDHSGTINGVPHWTHFAEHLSIALIAISALLFVLEPRKTIIF
jgi:hypothetical protein